MTHLISDEQDIAIIGMACRLPGARNVDEFWTNLVAGRESIVPVDPAALDEATRRDPSWVKAAAVLEGMEEFDAGFFGLTPREAELMDPQHRVFLECCVAALEHAGHAPGGTAVGVFAGASTNTYLLFNLLSRPDLLGRLDPVQIDVGNGADFLATRVSYKLDLRGPCYTVASACSTSLVATHIACQSLLGEECDLALAGGVSIQVQQPRGYRHFAGGIVSPDGHCRAFDARAEGTVFGSGAGVVVLRRLADALRDGDHIHAVIKGSAINNDGALKVGYTAPAVEGQAAVIAEALAAAGVGPETIGYVETHGTGTFLGDPIEVRALAKAIGGNGRPPCPIGSVKTNVGHLANAAGVASLIKAALALEHRQIPPTLHFDQANPEIDLAAGPFTVNARLVDFPARSDAPRRAGVSSFGVGGTNAHVVLEEAPEPAPWTPPPPPGKPELLVLSAKSPTALDEAARNLAAHLDSRPDLDLADVAYTLKVGRQPMAHRRAHVVADRAEAVSALRAPVEAPVAAGQGVAFLFPGQGAQHVDMARGLYQTESVFRQALDESLPPELLGWLFPDAAHAEEAARRLDETALAQPALFAVEHALARLWMAHGIQPRAMIGHSIGEYVAACLAGVMSVADAAALVAERGRLMQSMPRGAMLAVPLAAAATAAELDQDPGNDLAVAAVNAPGLIVVSGTTAAIDRLADRLAGRGVDCRRLHTSHAFHSAMMDPILGPFADRVRKVRLSPPKIPFVSNLTGDWIKPEEATSADYWARHLRSPVRFADGVATLLTVPAGRTPLAALLEVGPGQTLAQLVRPQANAAKVAVVASSRHPKEPRSDLAAFLAAVGRLWTMATASAAAVWPGPSRRRVPLPTYPFERQRYWVEPGDVATDRRAPAKLDKRADVGEWFYVPSWKRTPAPVVPAPTTGGTWLVFTHDSAGGGAGLADALARAGRTIVRVVPGRTLARTDGGYTIDPRAPADYEAVVRAAAADTVVHLWGVTATAPGLDEALALGFQSVVYLARALAGRPDPVRLVVVASDAQRVESADRLAPEKATLLGVCQVVPQEFPSIATRFIDVSADAAGALADEIDAGASDPVVALRGRTRWVKTHEPLRLPEAAPPARPLREHGVYLIVEGTSGAGAVVADLLRRTCQARLAFIEKETDKDAPAARPRSDVPADALVLVADPTDEDAMRRALATTLERFGRLDGAIYAAGSLRAETLATLAETDPAAAARHFGPKAAGVAVLEAILPDGLDFCLLSSSLSATLGGMGQAAHAAASHYMDAAAERASARGRTPWISVGWDAWQLGDAPEIATLARFAIVPAEGAEAARRILTLAPPGPIVVSTADLELRRRQGAERPPADHARPRLAASFVAPRDDRERAIAAVWQQVLGIADVGVNDNFFELGGHSLLAAQLRNHLNEVAKVDLPLRDLFENPTVAGIAELMKQHEADDAVDTTPIAERLRAAFPTERQTILETYLRARIAAGLHLGPGELPASGNLDGLDLRLLGAELEYDLRQDFKFQLYPHEVREHPSIAALARHLLAEMERLADPKQFMTDLPLSAFELRPYRSRRPGGRARPSSPPNPPMVFVHSSPRAGSTLFRVMLAGHPQLFCPPEVNLLFFDDLAEWRDNIGFGSEMEWTTAGLHWALMELGGLDSAAGQALVDELVARNPSTQEVYRRLQEQAAPRLLVDKTPSYSFDLPTLRRAEALFDRPRYLYLYRHPYPVMDSILRLRFDRLFAPGLFGRSDVDPYVVAETVWALSNRNLLAFAAEVGPERWHGVRYEDLVSDPAGVMAGVCSFLGVGFHERVLAPYDGKRERMMGGLGDPNIMGHKGIDKSLGEAWKKIAWPRALDPTTALVAERLGYELPRRAAVGRARAEELLANLDQLSDEQVATLLAELAAEPGA